MTTTLIILGLVGIALIAFHQYAVDAFIKMRKGDEEEESRISEPMPPPQVTPTVICNDIAIGVCTYYDINLPEMNVSVVSVDGDVVSFHDDSGTISTLPKSEFLIRYARRIQTTISNL